MLLPGSETSGDVRLSQFHKDSICNVQERLSKDCAEDVGHTDGLLPCLVRCARRDECVGASLAQNSSSCIHHFACSTYIACIPTTIVDFWVNDCVSATWNSSTNTCDGSSNNQTSNNCSNSGRYLKDCSDLFALGYGAGLYLELLDPDGDGQDLIRVFCELYPPSSFDIKLMVNKVKAGGGGGNFNKSWTNYVNGFHDNDGNIWGGFKTWHQLSQAGYQRMVVAVNFEENKEKTRILRDYQGLKLFSESRGYSFHVASTLDLTFGPVPQGAKLGDCFGPVMNVSFSTFDKDNDMQSATNCASLFGAGWWYKTCDGSNSNPGDQPCNLMGRGVSDWASVADQERLHIAGMANTTAHSHVTELSIILLKS